jgi:hypothetical protein
METRAEDFGWGMDIQNLTTDSVGALICSFTQTGELSSGDIVNGTGRQRCA